MNTSLRMSNNKVRSLSHSSLGLHFDYGRVYGGVSMQLSTLYARRDF